MALLMVEFNFMIILALPAIGAAVGVYLNGPLNRAMSLRDGFVLADFLGILGFAF